MNKMNSVAKIYLSRNWKIIKKKLYQIFHQNNLLIILVPLIIIKLLIDKKYWKILKIN
jgi:hypothetical protein